MLLPRDDAETRVESDDRETTATFRDRRWVFPNEDSVILPPMCDTTAEEIPAVIAERVIERLRKQFAITFFRLARPRRRELQAPRWGVCRLPWPAGGRAVGQ